MSVNRVTAGPPAPEAEAEAGAEPEVELGLAEALASIAAGAPARNAERPPRFSADALALLSAAGALRFNAFADRPRAAAASELDLVRRVAAADGSVGRIFDGHLNGVERIAVQGQAPLRDRELQAVAAAERLLGVWGGDPVAGEGPAAALVRRGEREVLRGVKTFCSGAGGLDRALVLAARTRVLRSASGSMSPIAAASRSTRWYRSHGLVASVSHRVVFHAAPVLARLGEPGAIAPSPGLAATRCARRQLGGDGRRRAGGHRRCLPAAVGRGRPRVWLAPLARAEALDRARRDLELFLLQHRLEPMLARFREAAIATARRGA